MATKPVKTPDIDSFLTGAIGETWERAAAALREPERTLALGGADFVQLVALLRDQRALPLFIRRLQALELWPQVPEERRNGIDRWLWHYKALAAVVYDEVVEVVSRLADEGLHPVILKGGHLAFHCYDAPELRPTSDVDILFVDRSEAERAHLVLQAADYQPREETRGGDPWLWSRHLPELESPRMGVHVELHGGLIFPPRDRRHFREGVLLDHLKSVNYGAGAAQVLSAEAAVVFAFAHAFVRHKGEPQCLTVFTDAEAIVRKEGAAFDWARLAHLAVASGFAQATAAGLRACQELLSLPIPEEIAAWCRETLGGARARRRLGGPQDMRSASHLAGIAHADGIGAVASMLFFSAFPRPAFMRWRYPDKARWPLLLLYPYRWTVQAGKAAALAFTAVAQPLGAPRSGRHPAEST